MDVEVDDKVYSYDEYWKILDKYYPVNEYNTGGTQCLRRDESISTGSSDGSVTRSIIILKTKLKKHKQ